MLEKDNTKENSLLAFRLLLLRSGTAYSCESAWLKKPYCVGPAVPYEYKYTTSRQRQILRNTGLLYMHVISRADAVTAVSVLHSNMHCK